MMSGSDILFTTMHRDRTQWALDRGAARSQGVPTGRECEEDVYKWPPIPALLPSSRLFTWARWEVV
ncbi:unnamed protein product, partial [Staurois parvus]